MKTLRILCEDGDSVSSQVSLRLFVLERGSAHFFSISFSLYLLEAGYQNFLLILHSHELFILLMHS